tara:strand:+ start:830 stop:1054 length:225 start_codon:yes stop_codon:yes gene_type:complete
MVSYYDRKPQNSDTLEQTVCLMDHMKRLDTIEGFEETKEDQLKKDFVKIYNDNLFEIFTVSLAILVTAYLIKKY